MTPHGATYERRIERALKVTAGLVARHGDEFLPFFEKLEAEWQAIERRRAARQRAIRFAGDANATRSSQRAF